MAKRYLSGRAYGAVAGKVGIKMTGAARAIANIEQKLRSTLSVLYAAVLASLLEVEVEAKRLLISGYYQPAYDTGRLYNSITSRIIEFSYTSITGIVGTSVYYAVYVHEGARRSASSISIDSMMDSFTGVYRMPPRPFLLDALKNKKDTINRRISNAVKKEMITG